EQRTRGRPRRERKRRQHEERELHASPEQEAASMADAEPSKPQVEDNPATTDDDFAEGLE
ncbi:MAG: hypothetical protein B7Z55_18095, partial [Planctomycetales bacterium 12-60-4]